MDKYEYGDKRKIVRINGQRYETRWEDLKNNYEKNIYWVWKETGTLKKLTSRIQLLYVSTLLAALLLSGDTRIQQPSQHRVFSFPKKGYSAVSVSYWMRIISLFCSQDSKGCSSVTKPHSKSKQAKKWQWNWNVKGSWPQLLFHQLL